ncbi:centrosomal protein of 126 kDa isoform X2 [Sphaerodactylus townsendi]|uniref:centrosomal protein of 126 kDa isoform X2 n=1 Tax=Sphaerodactylus townsendi TaxID=933632 RepID=UPI0020271A25|nr:centrosomal protein of 126 kDa isoform X2 [Sphaerodactylus townsendi]
MELGGGGGSGTSGGPLSYYSSFARASSAGGRQAEAAEGKPCWRRSTSDGALTRGVGRRAWSAFVPSSNLRIFLERDLSKERHELLKDQRLFHSRARKHSLETNKRRRALEEKWKEEEEKEQKFREQILRQRKLKLQEATERFQRGHLPFSQRKREGGVQKKVEPKLDEAFEKIQITGLHLPVHRDNGRITGTASSATKYGPFQWKQNTAKTGGDKIMEENDKTNPDRDLRNLEEVQQFLQSFHQDVNEIAVSESVGSADSLEAGEQTESFATHSEASSLSAQLDSMLCNSQESQAKNRSFSDSDNMTLSKNQHVNNWLVSLNTPNIQRTSAFHDILVKYNVPPPEDKASDPDQKPILSSTSEQKESKRCTYADNLAFMQNKRDEKCSLLKNAFSGTVSTLGAVATNKKAWTTPDPSPVSLAQEKHSEVLQYNQISFAQTPNTTAATPEAFRTGQWSSTVTYNNNGFSADCWQNGKDAHTARCTEDLDFLTGAEMEKCFNHVNNEASLFEETCKSNLDQQNNSVLCGDFAANLPDHDQQQNNNDKRKGLKLPKSILKKESKYEPSSSFKALVVNRGIRFGNQPPTAIRDSVELAKIKGKDADIQRNCKKLRWFDEINKAQESNDDEKCSEQSIIEIPRAPSQSSGFPIKATISRTNLRSIPSYIFNSAFLEHGQDISQASTKFAASEGSERNNETLNPFESTGHHIAKQAWIAPKADEIKPLPCTVDPKNPKSNPRKGKPKLIKRPKSAKTPSTFTPKNRKGTFVRPQSASEATSVMKTQGKLMVPHPPYKSVPSKRTDQNGSSLSNEGQELNRDTTESSSSQNGTCCSHMGLWRPSEPPPAIVAYDPLMKTSPMATTAQSVAQPSNAIKKSAPCSENEVCVDPTPADEEIKDLWPGVQSVLIQKDGAAGDSKHCLTHHNNPSNEDLQPTRTSVPHITIDGGNLINSVKPGPRGNGSFSSQPSTAVLRRKQTNDNIENKRKALLEQRRQMGASPGVKSFYLGQNSVQAVKLGPCQSASEPVYATGGAGHSDEVSDSSSQFLLAEQLVNTAATEGDILTYLDTVPQYKPTVVLNRPLRPGMSALSLEEHRVLESLDRLNHRLQNVQDTVNKNPSSASFLQTASPLVAPPSYVDTMPSIQRCKSLLADARTLTQKRY